jgi:hypothetical protein
MSGFLRKEEILSWEFLGKRHLKNFKMTFHNSLKKRKDNEFKNLS